MISEYLIVTTGDDGKVNGVRKVKGHLLDIDMIPGEQFMTYYERKERNWCISHVNSGAAIASDTKISSKQKALGVAKERIALNLDRWNHVIAKVKKDFTEFGLSYPIGKPQKNHYDETKES